MAAYLVVVARGELWPLLTWGRIGVKVESRKPTAKAVKTKPQHFLGWQPESRGEKSHSSHVPEFWIVLGTA